MLELWCRCRFQEFSRQHSAGKAFSTFSVPLDVFGSLLGQSSSAEVLKRIRISAKRRRTTLSTVWEIEKPTRFWVLHGSQFSHQKLSGQLLHHISVRIGDSTLFSLNSQLSSTVKFSCLNLNVEVSSNALISDVLGFELEKTGFMAAVPYLTMGILLGVSGYLADWAQEKGYLTTTQVRRYFNCGAFLAQTIFMMLAAFLLHPVTSMICITIAVGLGAFAWSGFAVNHLDVAPQYASILMGFSNTWATIPGIISPLLTGFLVGGGSTEEKSEQWKFVFYISAGIYLVGCLIYWFWASGEVQPWARQTETPQQSIDGLENKKRFGYTNKVVDIKDEWKQNFFDNVKINLKIVPKHQPLSMNLAVRKRSCQSNFSLSDVKPGPDFCSHLCQSAMPILSLLRNSQSFYFLLNQHR